MENKQMVQILAICAAFMVFIIFSLIFAIIIISLKERKNNGKQNENKKNEPNKENTQVKKSSIIYTPESIIDFMDFEKIEDNMILQKNGKFLMVIECQGINYDLMSEMEKVSVEQGFLSFLNTLRTPIQIYVQTRTVNLERSIDNYKIKLEEIEKKYNTIQLEYETLLRNESASKKDIDKMKYEILKQKNLKEYTEDIIRDVKRQSLNQSILSKKYYVIVHCYQSEISTGDYNKDEIRSMAFSELYTRARNIINSLFACQVSGKILNSDELVELLYMAYNRDDADLLASSKNGQMGFADLYSTSPDVLDKKAKALDKLIEEDAMNLANEKVNEARREKEQQLLEKEKNKQEIVKEKAKNIIKKHKKYIGEDISSAAIEKIEENSDEKKDKTSKVKKKSENTKVKKDT